VEEEEGEGQVGHTEAVLHSFEEALVEQAVDDHGVNHEEVKSVWSNEHEMRMPRFYCYLII